MESRQCSDYDVLQPALTFLEKRRTMLSPLRTRRLGFLATALQIWALSACAQESDSPTEAAARGDAWMNVHNALVKQAKEHKAVDLLFVGDSITQGWHATGTATWERFYVPRNVLNLGIGGDRTQHVLWRLDHQEVDGLKPKVVVLMIGTNNIGRNTNEEVVAGVKAVVERLRAKLPQSKILLLGVFPRGQREQGARTAETEAALDPRPAAVNASIAKLDNGKSIKYLDISKVFINENGRLSRSVTPDFLHLSRAGYRAWADAMEPTLRELMEAKE
jgi:lysophospholipase L1-like esterase